MGKKSRTKGAEFEREVASVFRAVWPGAKRGLSQSRGGAEVSDVDGVPYWVECKRRKKIGGVVADALEQGERDCTVWSAEHPLEAGYPPKVLPRRPAPVVAVVRGDNGRAVVAMFLEDWLAIATLATRRP